MARRYFTALMCCASLVAACNGTSSTSPAATTDPLTRSSVVASASPEFTRPTGPALHWHSDLIWSGSVTDTSDASAAALTRSLERVLEGKGYRFTANSREADYDVLAVAVLGDIVAHPEIEQLFRLYPSLRGDGNFGSGNVLFAVAPAGTTDIVWRGAIEVFTGEPLSDEARHLRIQKASEMLLGSIPPAPQHADE